MDIFRFLEKMNEGDFRFIDNMSDEEVKSIAPFVLLMWANGAKSNKEYHVVLTDNLCNTKVFQLHNHPRLLLKLFFAANGGIDNTRYSFVKTVSKEESATIKIVAEYYKIGYDSAKDYMRLLTKEDIDRIKEEASQ